MTPEPTTIVVPTVGRPSLSTLLRALAEQERAVEAPIVLVDDRPGEERLDVDPGLGLDVRVVRSGGGGPARARNLGWRHARTEWVSFLDDDVVPTPGWYGDLLEDLDAARMVGAVGSDARVQVPLPCDRRPTDWERGTAGLESARWITADLSYRRSDLSRVGGFDERFRRAFREDADLALRLGADRGRVASGHRRITHPVRPADSWISVRQQAGNADDQLMTALHGRTWWHRAEAPVGRRSRHVATTAAGLAAAVAGLAGRRAIAMAAAGGWLAGTAGFAWARIAPGPRDRAEVTRMIATSVAIPPTATYHSLRGLLTYRHAPPWRGVPDLMLLDRDGTLVVDVPYNGDPERVRPLPGAAEALKRLRAEGIRTALVTNQSGIARGLLTREQVDAVNTRVADLLGPFESVLVCPHGPDEGCSCRKPAPGMVKQAAADAGVHPSRVVMVGDTGADVTAAQSAGATGVLVPNARTRRDEVRSASLVAHSLGEAVDLVLGGMW
jgi:histidinol-phosphate phosphatase family protein